MKPIVHYKPSEYDLIEKGYCAVVFPIDHPSPLVSNTNAVQTTTVIKYNKETGEFETLNTLYKPIQNDTPSSCSSCC